MRKDRGILISWLSILLTLFLGLENAVAFSLTQGKVCQSNISRIDDMEEGTCCCSNGEKQDSCCDSEENSSGSALATQHATTTNSLISIHDKSCHCGELSHANQPASQTRDSSGLNSPETQKDKNYSEHSSSRDGVFNQNIPCAACPSCFRTCPLIHLGKVCLRI